LSILPNEPFGPRLHYYCQLRGKRFGIDWKFIYKYPAPTDQKRDRKRFLDLTWTVTPAQVKDKEYPGHALKDGDTIFVVNRRTPVDPKADELGPQVDVQRVHIQDGETTVWQKPETLALWYKNADKTLQAARNEVADLQTLVKKMGNAQSHLENQMAQLISRNTQLHHENQMLRQARVQVPQQRQQMLGGQHQMNPYMARTVPQMGQQQYMGQNQLAAYHGAGGYAPHNSHYALPPMQNWQTQPIRGQGAMSRSGSAAAHSAGVKTPPEDDEEEEEM